MTTTGFGNIVGKYIISRTAEREFLVDNLLVRIDFIIEMIWWTGLAPWELESPFHGRYLTSLYWAVTTMTTMGFVRLMHRIVFQIPAIAVVGGDDNTRSTV